MKKQLFIFLLFAFALQMSSCSNHLDGGSTQEKDDYVDLGLPSGTLWKNQNEPCGLITYDEAVERYGKQLPTKAQCEELRDQCKCTMMDDSGIRVVGPNGNSIVLPAEGVLDCSGVAGGESYFGSYWSATSGGSDKAWGLGVLPGGFFMANGARCQGQSVRLVQD